MSMGESKALIANVSIPLPDEFSDPADIERIAAWLNQAYDEQEKRVGRIDTPVVALSLAYKLAVELEQIRHQAEAAEEEMRETLAAIASQLERLAD